MNWWDKFLSVSSKKTQLIVLIVYHLLKLQCLLNAVLKAQTQNNKSTPNMTTYVVTVLEKKFRLFTLLNTVTETSFISWDLCNLCCIFFPVKEIISNETFKKQGTILRKWNNLQRAHTWSKHTPIQKHATVQYFFLGKTLKI